MKCIEQQYLFVFAQIFDFEQIYFRCFVWKDGIDFTNFPLTEHKKTTVTLEYT